MFNVCFVARHRSLPCFAPPVEINNRAPEDAVKPWDRLAFVRLTGGPDGFQQTFLHRVTGEFRISQASTGKTGERLKVVEQDAGGVRHVSSYWIGITSAANRAMEV
jgi:hypothetical protein